MADHTFLVKPGSDGALALGMMHLLVRENMIDQQFLASSVQGFEEFKQKILPDFPPDQVSRLTGLPVETIESMAQAFGKARAPFLRVGAGLSRYGNGAMNVRTILCLPALVGAHKKKGGGAFVGTGTAGAFPMAEILREDFMAQETRDRQYEPARLGFEPARPSPHSEPLRLSLQPGFHHPRPESGLKRTGPGRPLHRRPREIHDRHGPFRGCCPALHLLFRTERPLPRLWTLLHSMGQAR